MPAMSNIGVGLALIMMVLGWAACAVPAAAQDIGRWTDPTHTWSLDLAGWKVIGNSDLEPNDLFEVEPLTSPEDGKFRMCSAKQFVLPHIGGGASTINASIARFGLERARAVFGSDIDVLDVTHTVIDGVTVANVHALLGSPAAGTRIDYRVFNVATKGGPRHVQLHCGARNSLDAEDRAPVQAVLDSLQFLPVSHEGGV